MQMKLAAPLALVLAGPGLVAEVAAEDRALVVGNADYARLDDADGAEAAGEAITPLQRAGFKVYAALDANAADMRRQTAGLITPEETQGRRVILLTGHFVHSSSETWLLGAEAEKPGLMGADGVGLPLGLVLELAGRAPGGAVVLLGPSDAPPAPGIGLEPGIGDFDIPQGVTVIRGAPGDVAALAAGPLLTPGQSYAALAAGAEDVEVSGYVSSFGGLIAGADGAALPPPDAAAEKAAAERAVWETAKAQDTLAGYQAYLDRYPAGVYAATARAEVARIKGDPARQAAAAETALNLGRDQRREIQRQLTLLEFDTKGIDGIFGAGSRAAIRAWQTRNGVDPSGYLTREQMQRIAEQAQTRAAELEAEALRRQEAKDRADRAYWAETGAKGEEAGLRAYLKRYPDGIYAELAQDRVAAFDAQRAEEAAGLDRDAWAEAEAADSSEAYDAYLKAFPEGAFAETARERIAAASPEVQAAEAAEAALNLNSVTLRLLESRLQSLDLKPGAVDGVLDADSRRAIRRYQDARGLEVSGYLNEPTLIRLLADSLGGP